MAPTLAEGLAAMFPSVPRALFAQRPFARLVASLPRAQTAAVIAVSFAGTVLLAGVPLALVAPPLLATSLGTLGLVLLGGAGAYLGTCVETMAMAAPALMVVAGARLAAAVRHGREAVRSEAVRMCDLPFRWAVGAPPDGVDADPARSPSRVLAKVAREVARTALGGDSYILRWLPAPARVGVAVAALGAGAWAAPGVTTLTATALLAAYVTAVVYQTRSRFEAWRAEAAGNAGVDSDVTSSRAGNPGMSSQSR